MISALTATISVVVDRVAGPGPAPRFVWARTVVFAVCGLVSLVNPTAGIFALSLLALVRVAEVRRHRPRPTGASAPAEP